MADLKTYKRAARIANIGLSTFVVVLLVIGIIYWIYEEYAESHMYDADQFVSSLKLWEARMVLLVTYVMTLLFLVIIQCCIQIAKDPHSDHIGPRRLVWGVFGGLLVLCYIGVALLAGTYKSFDLKRLPGDMLEDLNKPYYNEFPGNFSEIGQKFNRLQSARSCCGAEGPVDYGEVLSAYNLSVPYSCCQLKSDRTGSSDDITQDDVDDLETCLGSAEGPDFKSGCSEVVSGFAASKADQLVIIGSLAAVIVLVGVVLRLSLGYFYQKLKKKSANTYQVNQSEDGSDKEPIPLVTKGEASDEGKTTNAADV